MNRQMIAKRLVGLAKALVSAEDDGEQDDMALDPLALQVAEFFKENPNPRDAEFHDWAEQNEFDVHEAEAAAYRLAAIAVSFVFAGKAAEDGFTDEDADPEELSMGIEVEDEHTDNVTMAKRIALDHLAEIDDYYTRLKKMEEDAGVED